MGKYDHASEGDLDQFVEFPSVREHDIYSLNAATEEIEKPDRPISVDSPEDDSLNPTVFPELRTDKNDLTASDEVRKMDAANLAQVLQLVSSRGAFSSGCGSCSGWTVAVTVAGIDMFVVCQYFGFSHPHVNQCFRFLVLHMVVS